MGKVLDALDETLTDWTSCGYSIPFMDYREERPTLQQWAGSPG